MRNAAHYIRILDENPSAIIGFTFAASAVYAAQYGVCEAQHTGTDEWKSIARRLKSTYGENLSINEVRKEMQST